MILFFVAFIVSLLLSFLIIRYQYLHAHLTLDNQFTAIQRSHNHEVPRIGGLAIMLGFIGAIAAKVLLNQSPINQDISLLMAVLPSIALGFLEDIHLPMGVVKRLIASFLSGALALMALNASIVRLDMPFLDQYLHNFWFAVFVTCFAVPGLTNACNIIDGMNGLLSGMASIVLIGIAYLAHQLQDSWIQTEALMLAGALIGFMLFNYPRGLIFLGDGGAYFIGVVLSVLLILLVRKHPELSPWCALLMVAYPVTETLYSVVRRLLIRVRIGQPDRSHLHQLVYHALQKSSVHTHQVEVSLNSATSPYLWVLGGVPVMLALIFRDQTEILMVLFSAFVALYVFVYYRLQRVALPEYLKVDDN